MKRKNILFLSLGLLSLLLAASFTLYKQSTKAKSASLTKPKTNLVAHEWGTFTSIAGRDGVAIDWRPLNGASDLPKFVYTGASKKGYRGTYGARGKGEIARIRMETPVIYFYTEEEMDVSVNVDFPQGKVTEWYPQASIVNTKYAPNAGGRFNEGRYASGINWGTIKLLPNEQPNYLREVSYSHYYPARETNAVSVQVCNADKTRIEKEKFLFYRGIGDFELPLRVRVFPDKNNQVRLKNYGDESIRNLIVFENRGGRLGFKTAPELKGREGLDIERPALNQSLSEVLAKLEQILASEGLYEKEAKAMIETWKDSWFEEGLRVFYVLPRKTTDKILPLTIEPKPEEIVRVLVGRAEVITPEMEKDVKTQVGYLGSPSKQVREEAMKNLQKRGRFYEPILQSILKNETDAKVKAQIEKLLKAET